MEKISSRQGQRGMELIHIRAEEERARRRDLQHLVRVDRYAIC